MKHSNFLIFLIIVISAACSTSGNNKQSTSDHVVPVNAGGYRASTESIEQQHIKIESYLKDDLAKGELVLLMQIKNDGNESVRVDYSNCGLWIDAERVVIPETKQTFQSEIGPGQEARYEIYYYPINTVDFYFRSDYRGDMKQQYKLKFDFISDMDGNQVITEDVTFKLSDAAYEDYLSRTAKEKDMQIFDFDFDGNLFATKQAAYLDRILPGNSGDPERAVLALTPSITMDQLIINIYAYQYKDTLTVNMRMLNQGAQSIQVLQQQAAVEISGKTITVSKHFSDSFERGQLPENGYIFKPGTRLHLLLKFHVPSNTGTWKLSHNWLLIHNATKAGSLKAWMNLFYDDISFKESSITKDVL